MHPKRKQTENILERYWETEKLSSDNKRELVEYLEIRETIDGVSPSTLDTDAGSIYKLAKFFKNKPFKEATQEDMMKFDKQLRNSKIIKKGKTLNTIKEATVCLCEGRIKLFYKYLFNKTEYKGGKQSQKRLQPPYCVSWFNTTYDGSFELPIDEMLTDEDIKKLLNACEDAREQAIICGLLDGGITVSELAKMKVKSVSFDELGTYFILPKGTIYKTKHRQRKVRLFLIHDSTQYIKEYLNHHRYNDDPEAYFIYSKSKRVKDPAHTPILGSSIYVIVKRIAKDSGVKKKIGPHYLRHNSATRCALKGFNEFMMRKRFGWSETSKMPSRYVHLVSSDVDSKVESILGIKKEETPEETLLQPILCPKCGHDNPSTNIICEKCSLKLDVTETYKAEQGQELKTMEEQIEKLTKQNERQEEKNRRQEEKNKRLEEKIDKRDRLSPEGMQVDSPEFQALISAVKTSIMKELRKEGIGLEDLEKAGIIKAEKYIQLEKEDEREENQRETVLA